jgi:hypothetical protein
VVATKAIPRITIRLNGPVTLNECERVTIRLPAANICPDTTQNSAMTDAETEAEDEEGNDLMDEVDRFLVGNDNQDEEDGSLKRGRSSRNIKIISFVWLLTASV